ncbi:MAG TPA: TonB-dependent receptor [Candidatus Sulfopaludibacter sp.]|nr:TonB-dependent receptor [Candidatus Sulfopaludibacter sp.]
MSGSVVDQSGAAIPGATVNVFVPGGREPVLTGKTNEVGLFTFMAVRPDTYDVGLEMTGFTRTFLRGVKVDPLQERALGAIKMEVQSATTSVDVAAEVPTVQLSGNENTTTITATQVQNLPVLGRQVTSLFQTQPGVTSGSNTTTVNGLRPSFTSVTLDGINIQDNFIRTNDLDYAPMRTTIDQVAEITVKTSNAGAGIGGGASQMVLSTKSGSNDYHARVYWYNRNSDLAGNNWFNNQHGTARTFLDLNQPGAALSGRIIRDKLFFYTNYELYRNKQQTSTLRTVLTDSARAGIFTYNDTTGVRRTVPLSSLRNFVTDPTVKAAIGMLPEPNGTEAGDGLNTASYRFNARGNEFRDQFVFKGDYYLSSKHGFSATYNYINNPTDRPDQGAFFTTVPPVSNTIQDNLLALSWRWTASPTLTNELRGGFMRSDTSFLDSNSYPKQIVGGLLFSNPVNTFLNQGRKVNTYNVQDSATWLKGRHEFTFGVQTQFLRTAPFNDAGIVPTYNLGISTANTTGITTADLAGGRSSDATTASNLYANLAGIISSASQTFNVTSATSGFVPGATNLRNFKWDTYSGYFQDKWKVLPNLTLNLGMRYEYWTPLDEKDGLFLAPVLENNDVKATVLDPNAVLNFIGGPSGRPFYKADKNNFAPNVGFAWDPFKDGKTSIRGGYMISYVNDNVVAAIRNSVGTSSGLSFGNTLSNLVANLASPPTVTSPTYKVPRTLADNYAITTTSATGIPDPNLVTPYVHQWTLGVQHEFKGTLVAVRYVGNHGSQLIRGVDYNQILYNASGFLADFQRAQSNASLAQKATGSYNGSYNSNIAGSQQLTVFPLLFNGGNFTNATIQTYLQQGQVGELANQYMVNGWNNSVAFYTNPKVQGANVMTNGGYSTYHGLQAEVTRRLHSGLQLQFSYSFSKSLSNTTGDAQSGLEPLLDNNNPSLEYARSPFDQNHVFKANYYYELPYGKGKKWSGNGLMNTVLGGWAISGIWGYESGSPYSILSGYGTLNRAARSTSTNTASITGIGGSALQSLTNTTFMTGNGPYFISPSVINLVSSSNPSGDGRGAAPSGSAAFAGQIFSNPLAGQVGNTQRRMFSGPWQWSWDASMKKSFTFFEKHTVDLHFDFFNYMNHPTFYVPPTSGDYGATGPFTINSTTFGKITSMNYGPRVIQIGAYYRF